MREYKITYAYAALQGSYWMGFGVIISFTAVFLLSHGFADSKIGILIALSSLLSVLLQPKIAAISDNSEHITLKQMMHYLAVATLLPIILLLIPNLPTVAIAIIYSCLILLHLSFQPLLSALGMQLIQQGIPLNFGAARGVGSMAYSILTFFLGSLTVILGTQCLPAFALVLYLIIIALIRLFPKYKVETAVNAPKRSTIEVIRANPLFAILLAGIVCIYVSHSSLNNYMFQILQHIGYGSTEVGHLFAFTAILEVPGLFLFVHIAKKWDCGNVIKVTSIFFLAKAVLVALASTLPILYAGYSFQMFSFALFTPAVVYYIGLIIPPEDQTKGQALITIACTTGGTIGSLIGGFIIEYMGVPSLKWITSAFCFVGMILVFRGAEKTRNRKSKSSTSI